MKTKVLKFGMPVMVFLLAIVFAFATNPETAVEESAAVNGYIIENGKCVQKRTCNNDVGPICMFGTVPVRALSGQQCNTFLTHWAN